MKKTSPISLLGSTSLALVLGACGSTPESDAPESELGGEATAARSDAIQNGSQVAAQGHTVRVNADSMCTGTVLRNDIVITARHCFSSPPVPGNYSVQGGWNGTAWTETVGVSSVDRFFISACSWCKAGWGSDDTDVAVLRLSNPLTLDGVQAGAFRALYPWEDANLDGATVNCEGAGSRVCDANGNPQSAGLLRSMATTVNQVQTSDTNGRYYLDANATLNQRILSGDSGGSCWVTPDTNYRHVFGANKVAACGGDRSSMILNQTMRPFVRSKLGQYATDYFTSFDSASDLSSFTVFAPPASEGGPPDWEISSGALREHSDMKGVPPSVAGTGTHVVHNTQVIANAWVTTKIYSPDDDSAGIIFRYVNERNYYRFIASENDGGRAIFQRVRNGDVTTIDSVNVSIDWSNGVELAVASINRNHWGYVNGTQVTYMFDKAHPDGRVGLHNRLLADASYVYFAVYHDDDVYPEPF